MEDPHTRYKFIKNNFKWPVSKFFHKAPINNLSNVSRFSKKSRKIFRTGTGSKSVIREKCSRIGNQSKFFGFLQQNFPCTETGWGFSSSSGLKLSKSVYCFPKIQNGNCEVHNRRLATRRLGSLDRPEGCILARADGKTIQEVPTLHLPETSATIPINAVRNLCSTSNIYLDYGQRHGPPEETNRSLCSKLLRRSTAQRSEQGKINRSFKQLSSAFGTPRLDCESQKIRSVSISSIHSPRFDFQHSRLDSVNNSRPSRETTKSGQSVDEKSSGDGKNDFETVRLSKFSSRLCPIGKTSYEASSVLSSGQMETGQGPSRCKNSVNRGVQTSLKILDRLSVNFSGCPNKISNPCSYSYNRCKHGGLGSNPSAIQSSNSRYVVNRHERPYQYPGNESNPSGSETFFSLDPESGSTSTDRQYHSGLVHYEARGDKIPQPVYGDMGTPTLVPNSTCGTTSETYSRKTECLGGLSIETSSDPFNGMVNSSCNLSGYLPRVQHTSNRPVCNTVEPQTPDLCFPLSGSPSSCSRRSEPRLDGSFRVRLSPICPGSKGSSKNSTDKLQNSVVSSLVAEQNMVNASNPSPVRLSKNNSSKTKSSKTTKKSSFSSKSSKSLSSRLAVIRGRLREEKFSRQAAKRIAESKRKSTTSIYDAKWRIFAQWCMSNSIDPTKITSPELVEFLLFLFEIKKLKPSTIRGYRSSISQTLCYFGKDFSNDQALSNLLNSFSLERPVCRTLTPKWNLSLVLDFLSHVPFEPLSNISIKNLTLKTVFLVALASARRVSELHAFSIDDSCFRISSSEVILATEPGFLAKNQLPGRAPPPVCIKALTNIHPERESKVLCPVRAINSYLKATEPFRRGRKRLFLSLQKGKDSITKNTVANWIASVIKLA